ncbi:cytochrome C oxidase Cbb3 [Adlercreutzia faecimuris]|uniref:Cytochrome C oxidase Cbb3 n=1 Tax=Adlercreutzia faecimuris TaxID=2897341 RepID=A0ABS9WI09_9ACTN|nr:cytochrome C oxidase Cbb3 [Adlercreutzia sp. JBNU-10]MCI2242513.1 cytochrome C oxidase Cbb3 [Adlercreutzia sp. JBNU-10]
MPTLRNNIAYACGRVRDAHGRSLAHALRVAAVIVAVALLLEVFVFNFNYFASAGYHPINLKSRITLPYDKDDDLFRLTTVDHVMEFSDLNTEVHNIRIDFDSDQPAQNLQIKVQFTDEAHQTYFDSTEYTVGVPVTDVSTMSTQSEYLNLNTAGYVDNLRIEVVGEDTRYPIKLWTVSLNAHHPFDFNVTRFAWTAGILALVYLFRPRSGIYRINIVENPRRSKAGIVVAVAVELALVSSFLFYGSNLVGVATSSYNYGSWDGKSIVNVYETGGENAQQYAELARAMAKGQLYLDEEPPDWLKAMDDPYDKGARDEAQKETGEPYLFDVAYHDGHYYVYFGVVPVLLFYLPFYLLTGLSFPTAIGVLIAALAFVLGCSALLDRFARYHFKSVSLGLYLLLQVPLVFCSGILYLVKFPTFYSLPIMCGLAFSVWGLYCWMRGRLSRHACAWYLGGSLCMALVAGCRPQLLVLSLLAFPLFWRTYITQRRLFSPAGAREFACLVAPYLVVAAGIMGYNYARFGSPTDFGANYNLTVNDMTKRGMNVGRLAPAFFAYFLQPPCVTGVFPFIQPEPFATTYLGQTIREVTFGGILACLPVLWVLAFSRRILALRYRQRATRTIWGVIVVLLASGVVVALLDAEMAGILQRYFADFSFMFLAATVLLLFIANENLAPGTVARDLLMKVLIVLVALSVLYSGLLCFVPETGWYSDIYPWAFQDVIEMVQFWT